MRKTCVYVLCALLLATTIGCSLISQFMEMTAKQRCYWFIATYNGEYHELMQQGRLYYQLTLEQQAVLRWKKALLEEVYDLIWEYFNSIKAGAEPDESLALRIMDLLTKILHAEDTGAPPEEEPVLEDTPTEVL